MNLTSEKSMLLATSVWGNKQTFRLIPMTNECPFLEGIYDPDSSVLILMSKIVKDQFHMMAVLDADGFPVPMKNNKRHADGTGYKKERRVLQSTHEYYITEKTEIIDFVKFISFNSEFAFEKFMVETVLPQVTASEVISPKLVEPQATVEEKAMD